MKRMKVLLVSPRDPDKPENLRLLMGGENTFTKSLLAHPPKGIEYFHHRQAWQEGQIVSTGWQKFPSCLMKLRLLPLDAGFLSFKIKERFDLIHSHGYCLKMGYSFPPPRCLWGLARSRNVEIPVVLSDSSSNLIFLKDYLGWSQTRINWSYRLRRLVSKKLNLYDPNLNLYQAKKLIVWSNFAKEIHQKLGADSKKMAVIPPGIEMLPGKKIKHRGFNILFVGIWLERKGGLLLLEAYRILKEKYPEIKLTLIGQLPRGISLPKDVWHQDYLSRERLIKKIFPQADVLVLAPPVVEGYGLVVLEAASLGIPAIVTRVCALPEIVKDQETGFVIPPWDLRALIDRLEKLIENRALTEKMGQAAKKRFLKEFWIRETNKKLLKVYQEAHETG